MRNLKNRGIPNLICPIKLSKLYENFTYHNVGFLIGIVKSNSFLIGSIKKLHTKWIMLFNKLIWNRFNAMKVMECFPIARHFSRYSLKLVEFNFIGIDDTLYSWNRTWETFERILKTTSMYFKGKCEQTDLFRLKNNLLNVDITFKEYFVKFLCGMNLLWKYLFHSMNKFNWIWKVL